MRGLPFNSTAADLVKFLAEFKVTESDCVIEIKSGRMTGMALAFLDSEEKRNEAIQKLNKKNIGNRYIELLPASIRT